MDVLSKRIASPELFIGLVAPVGVDLTVCRQSLRKYFEENNYYVIDLKVTDVFKLFFNRIQPDSDFNVLTTYNRTTSYIKYGNKLRKHFDSDELLSALTIARIMYWRLTSPHGNGQKPERTVYLLHQFKRKEEVALLRSVYGRCFFQVSVYSRRGARVDGLSHRFAMDNNSGMPQLFRGNAEQLIQTDEDESGDPHGQRVSEIFHDADVIINHDVNDGSVDSQIYRFCDLLFSSNKLSPTKDEYGMFAAKAAALRTLDLSRQVGAAIFTPQGEVLALGSNEVPKATGGTYWADNGNDIDDRDYVRGYDANDRRKKELLRELLTAANVPDLEKALADPKIRHSQFMDALEYGRIIHAEMSAISDAARLGRPLLGSTIYCTTFPCHMCAKHIVASGIKRVVFLEPYPKSLAAEMHSDSIKIEGADRGRYESYPAVEFVHFHGISPKRYRETFERGRRKDRNGKFQPWKDDQKVPLVDLKFPFYMELEKEVLKLIDSHILSPSAVTMEALTAIPPSLPERGALR